MCPVWLVTHVPGCFAFRPLQFTAICSARNRSPRDLGSLDAGMGSRAGDPIGDPSDPGFHPGKHETAGLPVALALASRTRVHAAIPGAEPAAQRSPLLAPWEG